MRNKLKGDQTDRIGLISDDRIIELHEKYRQRLVEAFRAKIKQMEDLAQPDSREQRSKSLGIAGKSRPNGMFVYVFFRHILATNSP